MGAGRCGAERRWAVRGAETFSERDRYEIGAMLSLRDQAQGPRCRPLGNWLVRMAQRTWPPFAGLSFWEKTNSVRNWVLISYHHPARLCWSWSIWIGLFRTSYGKGFKRFWRSYGGQWTLSLPYVLDISWHRQSYDWMLSGNAERRLEAVALYARLHESEMENA